MYIYILNILIAIFLRDYRIQIQAWCNNRWKCCIYTSMFLKKTVCDFAPMDGLLLFFLLEKSMVLKVDGNAELGVHA